MYLADRVACIAGKPGSHRDCIPIWERRGSNVEAGSGAREIAVFSDGKFSSLWELSSISEAAMGSLRCTWQTASLASRASPAPTGNASRFGGAAALMWSGAREIGVFSDGEFSSLWELSSISEAAMGSLRCTWQTASPASRASPATTGNASRFGGAAALMWERGQ